MIGLDFAVVGSDIQSERENGKWCSIPVGICTALYSD